MYAPPAKMTSITALVVTKNDAVVGQNVPKPGPLSELRLGVH